MKKILFIFLLFSFTLSAQDKDLGLNDKDTLTKSGGGELDLSGVNNAVVKISNGSFVLSKMRQGQVAVLMPMGGEVKMTLKESSFMGIKPVKATGNILKAGSGLVTLMQDEKNVWVSCGDCSFIAPTKPVVKKTAAPSNSFLVKGLGNVAATHKNWPYKKLITVGKTYSYSFDVEKVSGKGNLYVSNSWSKLPGKSKVYTKGKVSGTFKATKSNYTKFVIGADVGTTYRISNLKIK